MKILYVTFLAPSAKFGGGLGILKSLSALCKIGSVFYVGPEIKEDISTYNVAFSGYNYLSMESSCIARIRNLISSGSPSLFVKDWKRVQREIDCSQFDIVYLERTLQGFVCKWAWNREIPTVVMTHNVEYDFIRKSGPSKSRLVNFLFAKNARKNEKQCVRYANRVVALTEQDKNRFVELYGNKEKFDVIPVCVKESLVKQRYSSERPYILMTGSLWFGMNSDGIIWFLENVWRVIADSIDMDVVIAGSNPNEQLIECSRKSKKVTIIANPENMDEYYRGATLFVAPIFDGAGMKVKIAEAMSYGLPILATEHAAIGYENAFECISIFDSAEECKKYILMIKGMSKQELGDLRNKIQRNYQLNYSENSFYEKIQILVQRCRQNSNELMRGERK